MSAAPSNKCRPRFAQLFAWHVLIWRGLAFVVFGSHWGLLGLEVARLSFGRPDWISLACFLPVISFAGFWLLLDFGSLSFVCDFAGFRGYLAFLCRFGLHSVCLLLFARIVLSFVCPLLCLLLFYFICCRLSLFELCYAFPC